MSEDKEYVGTLTLGTSTSTQDRQGEIVETKPVPQLSENEIRAAFEKFRGDFYQTPPMVSAKKHGGVPLYKNGKIIGGLGISGDTACTDHEIAKRVRDEAGMNPPGGEFVDDIQYSVEGPSVFAHPLCPNTFKNGSFLGNEAPGSGY